MKINVKTSTDMKTNTSAWQLVRLSVMGMAAAIALTACGGGASTTTQLDGGSSGTGKPVPQGSPTGDMNKFEIALWNNIDNPTDRCGRCHAPNKQAGSYPFADINDLQGSYDTANQDKYINRSSPADSGMVKKFTAPNSHYCWDNNNTVCANALTTWITAWVTSINAAPQQAVQLVAQPGTTVTPTIAFPTNVAAGYDAVYDLLLQYGCNNCHTPAAGQQAQKPYFAVATGNPGQYTNNLKTSYDEVVSNAKINLIETKKSRLYLRLKDDHHNCGGDVNCGIEAVEMLAKIDLMAGPIQAAASAVDPQLVISMGANLYDDGIIASSGRRIENNMIASYDFKDMGGPGAHQVNDSVLTYGTGPYNLSIGSGAVEGTDFDWLQSWGLRIKTNKVSITGSIIQNTKMTELFSNGEYTIEAWVIPDNVNQRANIVGVSSAPDNRDFSLSQYDATYRIFNQHTGTADNTGGPFLETGKAIPGLQHIVVTYSNANGRRFYVDGVYTGTDDTVKNSSLANWSDQLGLVFGKEGGANAWLGVIRKVAFHSRALTADEVLLNFAAGVGQKYLLMFNINGIAGVPAGSYIYLQVQEYDDFSYLFYKPTYINLLDPAAGDQLTIRGMRIGINGREADIGQAFASIDTKDPKFEKLYVPGNGQDSGQVLSYVGTVIPKDIDGPSDQFFLSFEAIGTVVTSKNYHPQLSGSQLTPPPPNHLADVSDVMIRGFEEINATMSKLTGVPRTTASIGGTNGTYTTVYQQLPPTEAVDGFLASHQMAITQLAIQYCSELVETDANRTAVFGSGVTVSGMNFTSDATKDLVIMPLLGRVINYDTVNNVDLLADSTTPSENRQPTMTAVRTELIRLMNELSASCGGTCSGTQTKTIVKATCAAAMAGAPMLLQ